MKKFIYLLIAILFIFSFASFVVASNSESSINDDITRTIDVYYNSFMNEDMDLYLSTQYLSDYSREELAVKKDNIAQIWEVFDTLDYSLSEINLVIEEDMALAEYVISTTVKEGLQKFTYSMPVTAIMFDDSGFKISQIIPTAVLEKNIGLIGGANEEFMQSNVQVDEKDDDDLQDGVDIDGEGQVRVAVDIFRPICRYDSSKFNVNNFDLSKIPGVGALIGNDKIVELKIENDSFLFYVKDNIVNKINDGDVDYIVTTDSCTVERIFLGANVMSFYKSGVITLKGTKVGSKVRAGIGNLIGKFVGWFVKTPTEIWVEAESGELDGKSGSFIGKTSRGPGEIYLASADDSVSYTVKSKKNIDLNLYIYISDDAIHRDGTRDADFIVNGEKIHYLHKSKNTVSEKTAWEKVLVGQVHLTKGDNTVTIIKSQTTSAAFIMDKMLFAK